MKLCCYGKIRSNFEINRMNQKLGTTAEDIIDESDADWCVAAIRIWLKTAYFHFIVTLQITALTSPRLPNTMKLRRRWRSESVLLFFTSWSAKSLRFSTAESASASLGKWCKFKVDAVKASTVHIEHVFFKSDATSLSLLLERTSLSFAWRF